MFRSLFSRSRTVRVPIEHASSGVQVQKVRLYQPPVRPSLLLSTFFFAYVVYRLLEHAQEPSVEEKGKRKWEEWKKRQDNGVNPSPHSHDHQELQNIDLASDVVVRRIPIWFREKRGRVYHESDPEFQEYVRFQSDPKRTSSAISYVQKAAHNSIKQKWQTVHRNNAIYVRYQGPALVPLTDVEITPQLIAPPTYEVPAVFLYKDGVSVGWTALPPDSSRKWNAIFQPVATLEAAKVSTHVFFHMSYHIVRAKIYGSSLSLPPLPGVLANKPSVPGKEPSKDSSAIMSDDKTATSSTVTATSISDLVKLMHDGQSSAKRHSDMLAHLPLSYPIKAAAIAFRRKQVEGLARTQLDQTRGSVKITGKMVYQGRLGKYVVHVSATYLPGEDRYLSAVEYKPTIIADFAARQKMLDWNKKNMAENGGHHVCPPDGNCPVHGKVNHKSDCPHNPKNQNPGTGDGSVVKPVPEESKSPADQPTPDKNK